MVISKRCIILAKARTWYRRSWRGFIVAQEHASRIKPDCPLKPQSPKVYFWEAGKATKTTRMHLRSQDPILTVFHGDSWIFCDSFIGSPSKGCRKSPFQKEKRVLCVPIDPYRSALGHTCISPLFLLVNGCFWS